MGLMDREHLETVLRPEILTRPRAVRTLSAREAAQEMS